MTEWLERTWRTLSQDTIYATSDIAMDMIRPKGMWITWEVGQSQACLVQETLFRLRLNEVVK